MDNLLNDYGQLIEKLRKGRNMSRANLCEGIMSGRNYQRFANGEVAISSDKIVKLVDRLNMEFHNVNDILVSKYSKESVKLNKALKLTANWKNNEAISLLYSIDRDSLTSEYYKKLYDFTKLMTERKNISVESNEYYDKLKTLINYPAILEYKAFNHIEISGLTLLCSQLAQHKDRRIIDLLVTQLENDGFKYAGESTKYTALVYSSIAKALFHMGDFDECIDICNKGIRICNEYREAISLPLFFAYKAHSFHKLGNRDACLDAAIKLYFQLHIEGNDNKTKQFLSIAERNFNIDYSKMIQIKKGNA